MTHKYHTELKTKAGFKFHPGNDCDCKDYYRKMITETIYAFVRKEKCADGKPRNRCRWEMILVERGKGQIDKASGEDTFVNIQNILNQWSVLA